MTVTNPQFLADKVLQFLSDRIDTNYRVAVIIVGPPGSGKSTISERLCQEINSRYNKYLHDSGAKPLLQKSHTANENLCDSIPLLNDKDKKALSKGLFDHVQDTNFSPKRFMDSADGSEVIVGRGGIANSIRIKKDSPISAPKGDIKIAQIVPMDGFHLSREHLDHFVDPVMAHKRRGSPMTFDSNNCLQMCKILAKTCNVKPSFSPEILKDAPLFERISDSFSANMPSIYIPGFDHALKDPTTDQYCIDAFTRIIVVEGLYLLLDDENWKQIYPTFESTHAAIVWKLDSSMETLETRVAKRHLASGLVSTFTEGVERFKLNDLLNAVTIRDNSLDADGVIVLSNE